MTRVRDLVVALLGLIILSPLLLAVSLIIQLDSPGGAIYRQERVGLRGKSFRIHKFRTMRQGAGGLPVTAGDDPRVTRCGRWLRATKLDELPQLIDIIQGNMSLVGPRPEVPYYASLWPEDAQPIILSVRPGLTDPATVQLRHESSLLARADDPELTYIEDLLPMKARAYVAYVSSRSFVGDFRVILATAAALVKPNSPTIPCESERSC